MNDPQDSNSLLLDRFQTLSELAKSPIGGLVMSLYLPEQRVVALRSLPVETKLSAEDCTRLLEAARWVKGLDDPAIMMPLDAATQEGLLHAAYHYRVSEPLRAVLRLSSFKGNPMPPGVALRIAHDTVLGARAIEACGASPSLGESLCGGLIPDSILIGQDGKSRICDAGIGAILRRTHEYGQQAELLSYAAPEQLDPSGIADSRSDVFTIGVFLWEMLANRRLFAALDASEVIDKVRTLEVPTLDTLPRGAADSIPEAVGLLVKRALAREPGQRYAGTTALLQALETQAGALMAPSIEVGAYVSALVGNIFETRARAIERAKSPNAEEDLPTRNAAEPKPARNKLKSVDISPRAAATKNPKSSPKGQAPIPPPPPPRTARTPSKPKLVPTPLPLAPANANSAPRAPIASSPPVIAALVDDAIAQGVREAQRAGSVHPTIPPPANSLQTVIPALPTLFELPGAELFATPGLSSAKPIAVEAPKDSVVDARTETAEVAIEPEPNLSEAAANELPAKPDPPALLGDATATVAHTPLAAILRQQRPRIALALLSALAMAFLMGVAIRRCSSTADRAATRTPDSGAAQSIVDASATGAVAVPDAVPDANPAVEASVREQVDAGPAAISSARVTPAPVRRRKSTAAPRYNSSAAPHYNSKVVRGRAKTTR